MPRGIHSGRRGPPKLTNEQHIIRGTRASPDMDNVLNFEKATPDPPEELNEEARAEWKRMAPLLQKQGLLTVADMASFAVYCQAFAAWKSASRAFNQMQSRDHLAEGNIIRSGNGQVIANPLVKIVREAQKQLLAASAEFGLTPVSRQRMKSEMVQDQHNPFTANERKK